MKKIKVLKLIFMIVQIMCLMFFIVNNSYANMYDIYMHTPNPFYQGTSRLIAVIQAIAMSVAVIMLTMIGIKYIIASPEGKADLKQQLIPYLIGCVLLFAGSALIGVIAKIAYETLK